MDFCYGYFLPWQALIVQTTATTSSAVNSSTITSTADGIAVVVASKTIRPRILVIASMVHDTNVIYMPQCDRPVISFGVILLSVFQALLIDSFMSERVRVSFYSSI